MSEETVSEGNRNKSIGDLFLPDVSSVLIKNPTIIKDGYLHIRVGSITVPILVGNAPIVSFFEGWTASYLYTAFAPLFLLELEHDLGQKATWFLDHRMQRVGDNVQELTSELQDLVRMTALPNFRRLLVEFLVKPAPKLDPYLHAMNAINNKTRENIAAFLADGTPAVKRRPGRPPGSTRAKAAKTTTTVTTRKARAPAAAEPVAVRRKAPVAASAPKLSEEELRGQIEKLERTVATLQTRSREAVRSAKQAAARDKELEDQLAATQKQASKPPPAPAWATMQTPKRTAAATPDPKRSIRGRRPSSKRDPAMRCRRGWP